MELSEFEFMVRGRGYPKSVADIEDVVLKTENGTPLNWVACRGPLLQNHNDRRKAAWARYIRQESAHIRQDADPHDVVGDHDQLRQHLADFVAAYNFGRRLETLKGLTP